MYFMMICTWEPKNERGPFVRPPAFNDKIKDYDPAFFL
jgi:hypothetical protein